MPAFSSRTEGYKAGVFLLFIATIVFLVGFGAPYWLTADGVVSGVSVDSHRGLWLACSTGSYLGYSSTACSTFDMTVISGWFTAVRALESLCTTGLIIACIYALANNCCRSVSGPQSKALEAMAGFSGILGFIGCMVYVGKYNDILNKDIWDYDWAFYLAAVGSGLVVIAAIVIAVNNKPVDVQPNTGGMVMMTATAQPQPYVVQPGNYPPQPCVAQPGYYPSQSYPPPKAGYPAQ